MEQLNYQPGKQCIYNVSEPLSTLDSVLVSSYEMEGYANRPLSRKEQISMLDMHGQDWHVVPDNNKLYASECGDEYTDVTSYDLFDMLNFLNY